MKLLADMLRVSTLDGDAESVPGVCVCVRWDAAVWDSVLLSDCAAVVTGVVHFWRLFLAGILMLVNKNDSQSLTVFPVMTQLYALLPYNVTGTRAVYVRDLIYCLMKCAIDISSCKQPHM